MPPGGPTGPCGDHPVQGSLPCCRRKESWCPWLNRHTFIWKIPHGVQKNVQVLLHLVLTHTGLTKWGKVEAAALLDMIPGLGPERDLSPLCPWPPFWSTETSSYQPCFLSFPLWQLDLLKPWRSPGVPPLLELSLFFTSAAHVGTTGRYTLPHRMDCGSDSQTCHSHFKGKLCYYRLTSPSSSIGVVIPF